MSRALGNSPDGLPFPIQLSSGCNTLKLGNPIPRQARDDHIECFQPCYNTMPTREYCYSDAPKNFASAKFGRPRSPKQNTGVVLNKIFSNLQALTRTIDVKSI